MTKRLIGFSLILLLLIPVSAECSTPLETIKGYINRVLPILQDPALKGESGRKIKKDKMQAIAEEMFDFTELSRRSLGPTWNKMTPDQQKEFVKLYETLLKETYADRIVSYTNEKVTFGKENPLSQNTVEVPTTVTSGASEVAINYRVINENGQWKVYDVVIEGVSLISNYRSQFREILANNTPAGLLDVLRKKVKAQAS